MQYINENSWQLSPPGGLQELMSDITREVIRAQPQNVYSFIANYLRALLEVRDHMSIAAEVCNSIQDVPYHRELVQELGNIGIDDADVDKAAEIIIAFLESDQVEETKLFLQILRNTSIDEDQLEAVQSAVQRAFRKHRLNQNKISCSQTNITCANASSTSLAGSFVSLPRNKPYSAHDNLSIISEGNTISNSDTKYMSDNVNDDSDTLSLKTINFAMYS